MHDDKNWKPFTATLQRETRSHLSRHMPHMVERRDSSRIFCKPVCIRWQVCSGKLLPGKVVETNWSMRNAAPVALTFSRYRTLRYWPHTPKQSKTHGGTVQNQGKVVGFQTPATAWLTSNCYEEKPDDLRPSTHCLIISRLRSPPRHKYVNFYLVLKIEEYTVNVYCPHTISGEYIAYTYVCKESDLVHMRQ